MAVKACGCGATPRGRPHVHCVDCGVIDATAMDAHIMEKHGCDHCRHPVTLNAGAEKETKDSVCCKCATWESGKRGVLSERIAEMVKEDHDADKP